MNVVPSLHSENLHPLLLSHLFSLVCFQIAILQTEHFRLSKIGCPLAPPQCPSIVASLSVLVNKNSIMIRKQEHFVCCYLILSHISSTRRRYLSQTIYMLPEHFMDTILSSIYFKLIKFSVRMVFYLLSV